MPNENNLYKALLNILSLQDKKDCADNQNVCFMLHDEQSNEIHKIELDELDNWANDRSFEKTDKLYVSILIKAF